jgi:BirA family transcriptional regulator, biotin operon repressor / biotin---[acetyl-CoA-carboxylase] ligase
MSKFKVARYKKFLRTVKIGKNIIYLDNVDSTNNLALRLLKGKAKSSKTPDGTVVLAETQEKGRGRLEKLWLSPPGGLWFTLILKTGLEERKLPEITLITAYSVAYILNKECNIKIAIKWPNDLYYKKAKLGGILTEAEKIDSKIYLIIGLGINVNVATENLTPFQRESTTIRAILGKDIDREYILAEILLELEKNYDYYSRTEDFKTIFKKMEQFLDYGTGRLIF